MPLFTPRGTFSYPHVFVSKLPDDPKPTDRKAWSTTFLVTKEDTEETGPDGKILWDVLAYTVIELAKTDFPGVTGKIEFDAKGESFMMQEVRTAKDGKETVTRRALRMPFRKNVNGKYDEKFLYWVNARKVDLRPDKDTVVPGVVGRDGRPLLDRSLVYAGARGRLTLSCFSYKRSDNSGVSFGLNNVKHLGDGPRIAGAPSASDEFGSLDEGEAPDDMGGLLG